MQQVITERKPTFREKLAREWKKNKWKYILLLPVVVYLILICYKPMYGVIIAFKNYRPNKGIMGSEWVGFKHFATLFSSRDFPRILRNTFTISGLTILFGFPAPILLALLLNEIHCEAFKRTVQTITYLPHFIAMVIICGLIKSFCLSDGLFNAIITAFGGKAEPLLQQSKNFYPIYVLSDIWQQVGWGSIIYLAAIAGVDQEQYEAARIDGAGRLAQIRYITLPGIKTTIVVMFILRMGGILNVGYEKILLLYNPATYDVADVISTYTYRVGLQGGQWSFSTAVGLFNSVVNIVFLVITNTISKKYSGNALY
ncbi:MAG: ABC transporter permease [Aristaeellaceae bacterium]